MKTVHDDEVIRYKHSTSVGDTIFHAVSKVLLILLIVSIFYPLWFIVVSSFSDPKYVNSGGLLLYPKGFNILGYERVFGDADIWTGYANTILYTVCGTALGAFVTLMAGYSLSRRDLPGRKIIMKLFVFTMYFSGGMIPFFLVIKSIGLTDTRLVLVLTGSLSVYNIIITRSFMESNIPFELYEAASIDGCGAATFFFKVVLPLSKAIGAVVVLFVAVTHWNSYFNAMILISDEKKYPLQLVLRRILLTASASGSSLDLDPEIAMKMETMSQVMKYSIIVIATLPILCVYPFLQKYFVKGVTIGSVKG